MARHAAPSNLYACGMDWGDVPTWVQAVSTFLALGAAIVAGSVAAKAFNLERRVSEQRDDDKRAEQAIRIAAWSEPRDAKARLINTSLLPVYDVVLHFASTPSPAERHWEPSASVLPPRAETLDHDHVAARSR